MRKLFTLLLLFCLWACQSESGRGRLPKTVDLITPSGETIETKLALTPAEQEQGLSGVQASDFDENDGMLFFYLQDDEKHFWMPDTYFDLDLIFVDQNFKIVDIIRKLPFYIGKANPDLIPRARGVWSRHTLEMKATSPISAKLKIGDELKWKSPLTPKELEDKIKQRPAPTN